MGQRFEFRASGQGPEHTKPTTRIFQRRYNLMRHLAWLKANAYHLHAVQRREVGVWEDLDVSDPAAPNPESGSAAGHTADHNPDPETSP